MAERGDAQIELRATLDGLRADVQAAVAVVAAAAGPMQGAGQRMGEGFAPLTKAHQGLLGTMREFQQEQRQQGRMARFYAGELLSLVPAADGAKAGLQGLAGVIIEGAAGGLSFGFALEAAKLAIGLFAAEAKEAEETARAIGQNITKLADDVEAAWAKIRGTSPTQATEGKLDGINKMLATRARLEREVADAELEVQWAEEGTPGIERWNEARKALEAFRAQVKAYGIDLDATKPLNEQLFAAQSMESTPAMDRAAGLMRDAQARFHAIELEGATGRRKIVLEGEQKILEIRQRYQGETGAGMLAMRDNQIAAERRAMDRRLEEERNKQLAKSHVERVRLEELGLTGLKKIYAETDTAFAELNTCAVEMTAEQVAESVRLVEEGEKRKVRIFLESLDKQLAAARAARARDPDAERFGGMAAAKERAGEIIAGQDAAEIAALARPWMNLAQGISSSMAQGFASILTGAKSLEEGFEGIFEGILTSFEQLIADMLSRLILSGILSFLGSLIGGPVGGFLGQQAGNIMKFDVGSWSVPRTMPAIVDEGEIIVPPGPSADIRAGRASLGMPQAAAAGPATVMNVYLMSFDGLDAKQKLLKLKADLERNGRW